MRGSDKSDLGTGGGGGLKIVVLVSSPPLGCVHGARGSGDAAKGGRGERRKNGNIFS